MKILKPEITDKVFLNNHGVVYMTSDMLDEEIQEYKDGTNVEVNGVTLTIKGPVHVFKLLHYDERTGRSAKRISFIAG